MVEESQKMARYQWAKPMHFQRFHLNSSLFVKLPRSIKPDSGNQSCSCKIKPWTSVGAIIFIYLSYLRLPAFCVSLWLLLRPLSSYSLLQFSIAKLDWIFEPGLKNYRSNWVAVVDLKFMALIWSWLTLLWSFRHFESCFWILLILFKNPLGFLLFF